LLHLEGEFLNSFSQFAVLLVDDFNLLNLMFVCDVGIDFDSIALNGNSHSLSIAEGVHAVTH
jgi:hypothetical protein